MRPSTVKRVVRREQWCVSLDNLGGDAKRDDVWYQVSKTTYDAAPWWERLVYDGGERVLKVGGEPQLSAYPNRFLNSLIIAISSTFLAVAMGTITAYGFSRFRITGEPDLLFFILSTRMLPPGSPRSS